MTALHDGKSLVAASALYAALAAADIQAIHATLADDLDATISSGMPLGVGGEHRGSAAMLRDVWGPIFAAYDVTVQVDEMLPTHDGRVVVLGSYRGTRRADGQPIDAAFAHVLTIQAGVVGQLMQITDTARWLSPT